MTAMADEQIFKAVRDADRGRRNLAALQANLGPAPFESLVSGLGRLLPRTADPDMALNNLDRFVQASRSPLATGSLFERDREALGDLLQIMATSQYLSDLL
ncbi:MAG TPA: hypothetical protein VGL71_03070, partial [Urbifossiella sp.]